MICIKLHYSRDVKGYLADTYQQSVILLHSKFWKDPKCCEVVIVFCRSANCIRHRKLLEMLQKPKLQYDALINQT